MSRKMVGMSRRSARSMRASMSSTFQSSRLPRARATRGLAGAHEADQIDLVGLHARSLLSRRARADRDRRRSAGYDTATASAPSIVRRAASRRARRSRTPWPAGDRGCACTVPPVRRVPRAHLEAVGPLVGVGAHRAQAGDQLRDAIALLDAQLARAGHRHAAAERAERREHGQLVDHLRHFIRRDHEVASSRRAGSAGGPPARRSSRLRRSPRRRRRSASARRAAPSGWDSGRHA